MEQFPADLLDTAHPIPVLDRTLAAFILEARRADGAYYPGNTLRNILSALHRKMKETQGAANVTTFLNGQLREKFYPQLHNALDRQLRFLRNNGIGIERKRAQIITHDIEEKLWEEGVIGVCSPQALLNAVFFYNGKNLPTRGCRTSQTDIFTTSPILQSRSLYIPGIWFKEPLGWDTRYHRE